MSRDSNQLANQIAPETEQATVRAVREPYPTIWEVPDAVWEKLFLPLLSEFDPPSPMGRPRVDPRPCLNGMIYRARTGCQWNHLPQEFGSDSTVHRTVYRWDQKGIFDRLWALLIYHCEDLNAVHWEWQSADGCLSKARFIGKKGAKANRARHRKAVQKQAVQKQAVQKQAVQKQAVQKQAVQKQLSPKVPKTLKAPKTLKVPKAKASVQTPRTVASWASSKAYLLKQEADLWLSASQGPT